MTSSQLLPQPIPMEPGSITMLLGVCGAPAPTTGIVFNALFVPPTFTNTGTFSYVDVGEAFLGMRGSIIVTPAG